MDAIAQANIFQHLRRARFAPFGIDSGIDEWQLDITQRRRSWQKVKRLKHEADFPIANGCELVVVHFRNVLAVELVAARSRGIETTEHVHQR